jgi:hypothetical protein
MRAAKPRMRARLIRPSIDRVDAHFLVPGVVRRHDFELRVETAH